MKKIFILFFIFAFIIAISLSKSPRKVTPKKRPSTTTTKKPSASVKIKRLEKKLKSCMMDVSDLNKKYKESTDELLELNRDNNKLTLLYNTCRKNRTILENWVKTNCPVTTLPTMKP
uniref:Uncharacterized protein n=1 Tax=Parastrongyloides trichosuri TaxID=131310 RepID=A0A0N5A2V3_PARTI